MPYIPPERRQQNAAPPAQRKAWYCQYCRRYPNPEGWAQNSQAAEIAGLRHFHLLHDTKPSPPRQEPDP